MHSTRACIAEALPHSNPTAAARLLRAAMHDPVSLELKGYYLKAERASELFDAAVEAALHSFGRAPESTGTTQQILMNRH